VANYLQKEHAFRKYSLSDVVRAKLIEAIGNKKYDSLDGKSRRRLLQDKGNELRKEKREYLAETIVDQIRKDKNFDKLLVIDSIRNTAEVEHLRSKLNNFYLVAVDSNANARWARVKTAYEKDEGQFIKDDLRDKGENEPDYGQQTELCVLQADIVINNDKQIEDNAEEWKAFYKRIKEGYLDLMLDPGSRNPTHPELYMHQAYAISLSSTCSKKRVGAIIVDESRGSTQSYMVAGGCNNVPDKQLSCASLGGKITFCHKDDELAKCLKEVRFCPKCGKGVRYNASHPKYMICPDAKCNAKILTDFIPGRSLDVCRAVHAEEAAIIQAGKLGGTALEGTTMYTTTFPCLLCAKSIIDAGIIKVVYREPYPMDDAVKMLTGSDVELIKYQGVNPWAFFKLYKSRIIQ